MSIDLWHWQAHYRNDSIQDEYDEHGQHGFAEVDHDQLDRLVLTPQYEGLQTHVVLAPADGRLIFFRRRNRHIDPVTDTDEVATTAHCIGIERDGHAVYTFLLFDNSIVVSDDLNAI